MRYNYGNQEDEKKLPNLGLSFSNTTANSTPAFSSGFQGIDPINMPRIARQVLFPNRREDLARIQNERRQTLTPEAGRQAILEHERKNAILGTSMPGQPYDKFLDSKRIDALGFIGNLENVGNRILKNSGRIIEGELGGFKNFNDLSVNTLGKLEGRTTVSKQFISDLTNAPDLKQAERDIIRKVLIAQRGNQVDVPDFANKVKSELLPLKVKGEGQEVLTFEKHKELERIAQRTRNPEDWRRAEEYMQSLEALDLGRGDQVVPGRYAKYESVTLPDEVRGPVANYYENVYESPIKTSAGDIHGFGSENYFAHSRIEDLPNSAVLKSQALGEPLGDVSASGGTTRRVIEIQSDLFQKGRLEGERGNITYASPLTGSQDALSALKESTAAAKAREAEVAKLEPYRNTWHERIIREEIKKAALDGKTKLQFPTGETAMKIEGLGVGQRWDVRYDRITNPTYGDTFHTARLSDENLKVGAEIYAPDQGSWIITDVLGDGKFKAVQKSLMDSIKLRGEKIQEGTKETFDISGKVDTNNPIYKFYEKEVGKYLKNKYGAELVTDAQGVKWWEVNVDKGLADQPITAFALDNYKNSTNIKTNGNGYKKSIGEGFTNSQSPKSFGEGLRGLPGVLSESSLRGGDNSIGGRISGTDAFNRGKQLFGGRKSESELAARLEHLRTQQMGETPIDRLGSTIAFMKEAGIPKETTERLEKFFKALPGSVQSKFFGVKQADKSSVAELMIHDQEWGLGINPAQVDASTYKLGRIVNHEMGGHLSYFLAPRSLKKDINTSTLDLLKNPTLFDEVFLGTHRKAQNLENLKTSYYLENVKQIVHRLQRYGDMEFEDIVSTLRELGYLEKGTYDTPQKPSHEKIGSLVNIKQKLSPILKEKYPESYSLISHWLDNESSYMANEIFARMVEYSAEKPLAVKGTVGELIEKVVKGLPDPKDLDASMLDDAYKIAISDDIPIEVRLQAMRDSIDTFKGMLSSHPGSKLAKFANRNGEIPENLGHGKGKFARKGDDIASQLGLEDSESAREAYQDYLKGKERLSQLQQEYKDLLEEKRGNALRFSSEGMPLAPTKRQREILNNSKNNNLQSSRELSSGQSKESFLGNESRQSGVSKSQSDSREIASEQSRDSIIEKSLRDSVELSESKNLGPVTTEGELRSLELSAKKALGARASEGLIEDISYTKLIQNHQTDVKKKVNMLDMFRTPDRVLKKIGLERESKFLRQQYDKYLKELPKNIDKITDWSKQVPKESNKRIFKWLDGQAIDLRPEEKKVALEIKAWLSTWADRLGIPRGQRIGNYITHIFEDQLIKKEFDEDLAKIIAEKIPGAVYDPFLEKRLGSLGYKEDTWKALDAYVKRATRKVHMDPALEIIEARSTGLEQSQWDYVKKFVDRVNLRPTETDTKIDNFIKSTFVGYKLGQRPLSNISRFGRQMVYRSMLGLNLSSALKNLSQGANTYAKLGEKYTTIGYLKLLSPANHKELIEEGILNNGFIQDRALSATKKAVEHMDTGLFVFFNGAERILRGAAYFGAKSKALSAGKSEEQAIEFAKEMVRTTQFTFGSIDTPPVLQSDLGKTLGQFQSFTVKQTEFLAEMAKNKEFAGLIRYALAGTAFVYTIGQLFGMEEEDLIPTFRLGWPPTLEIAGAIGGALYDADDKYGNEQDIGDHLENIGGGLANFIPAFTQAKKSYQGYEAVKEGKSTTKNGRYQYDVGGSPLRDAQAIMFGKYSTPGAKDYYDKDKEPAPAKTSTKRYSY